MKNCKPFGATEMPSLSNIQSDKCIVSDESFDANTDLLLILTSAHVQDCLDFKANLIKKLSLSLDFD